jgi:hypothetical protein
MRDPEVLMTEAIHTLDELHNSLVAERKDSVSGLLLSLMIEMVASSEASLYRARKIHHAQLVIQ